MKIGERTIIIAEVGECFNGNMISHSKPTLSKKETAAIADVIKTGKISAGVHTREFESGLANYIGCKYATAVNSGTSALISTLLALEIGPYDEVIIPAYTCSSVYFAVKAVGAEPVLADINLDTFSIDQNIVKELITPNTTAIILVHNFGIPAQMNKILERDIPVIEDCAHAIGGSYNNKKLGSFGIASIFSFYATKMITTGEGGAVLTNSKKLKNAIDEIKNADSLNNKPLKKFNFKFTDIQAAMGKVQLEKIDSFIRKRRRIAKKYNATFQKIVGMGIPERDFSSDTFYRYILKMPNKNKANAIIDSTNKSGISCDRPVQTAPFLFFNDQNKFKNSKIANDCLVSIPIYPSLSENDVKKIIYNCKIAMKNVQVD